MSAGMLRWVCVKNSIHMTPPEREGNGHEHDQRIDPALKVNHEEEVDEHDGKGHAAEQAGIAFPHGLDLAAQCHLNRFGRVGPVGGDHLVDRGCRRIEIPALHVGMDVEDRPDVELRHGKRNGATAERRDIHEELVCALRPPGRHRQRPKVLRGSDLVSRQLHDEGIAHAVVADRPRSSAPSGRCR